MKKAHHVYTLRIDRVIDYLRDHLDQPIKLENLAAVACFSEYHFHRVFSAITGETVKDFTNRLRLEKAARLLSRTRLRVTEIAISCGFSSSATFSRSFLKAFDTTPSQYRKMGELKNSKICKDLFAKQGYLLPMTIAEKKAAFPVKIKTLAASDVAYIRVANAFEDGRVLAAFATLLKWLQTDKKGEIYDAGTLFGMAMDDPAVTPKKLFRYEVCFATDAVFDCPQGISKMHMPARTYATTRVRGDIKLVATAWDYLIRGWLIESNFEPDDAPALEIFLDKANALDWRYFDLELAFPVKKLKLT